jgi:hypothetical protein
MIFDMQCFISSFLYVHYRKIFIKKDKSKKWLGKCFFRQIGFFLINLIYFRGSSFLSNFLRFYSKTGSSKKYSLLSLKSGEMFFM